MIPARAAAASKAVGIKVDRNWDQAEPRQRPSNKAFGGAFPGGTGPRPKMPVQPRDERGSGVYYGRGEHGTKRGGVYKKGETRA